MELCWRVWSCKENFEYILLLSYHHAVAVILIFGKPLHDSILGVGSHSMLALITVNEWFLSLNFNPIWLFGKFLRIFFLVSQSTERSNVLALKKVNFFFHTRPLAECWPQTSHIWSLQQMTASDKAEASRTQHLNSVFPIITQNWKFFPTWRRDFFISLMY